MSFHTVIIDEISWPGWLATFPVSNKKREDLFDLWMVKEVNTKMESNINNINNVIDLAEKHNTMGYVLQEKLHKIVAGEKVTLDDTERGRIEEFMAAARFHKVDGSAELSDKIKSMPKPGPQA